MSESCDIFSVIRNCTSSICLQNLLQSSGRPSFACSGTVGIHRHARGRTERSCAALVRSYISCSHSRNFCNLDVFLRRCWISARQRVHDKVRSINFPYFVRIIFVIFMNCKFFVLFATHIIS